jgi:hypothetical protein
MFRENVMLLTKLMLVLCFNDFYGEALISPNLMRTCKEVGCEYDILNQDKFSTIFIRDQHLDSRKGRIGYGVISSNEVFEFPWYRVHTVAESVVARSGSKPPAEPKTNNCSTFSCHTLDANLKISVRNFLLIAVDLSDLCDKSLR